LEVCNFLFDFTGVHSQKFASNLRGDFEFGLLNNVGTVMTLETLGERLNISSMMAWSRTFGSQDRMLWFEYETCPQDHGVERLVSSYFRSNGNFWRRK
jgi:hypothetical protein